MPSIAEAVRSARGFYPERQGAGETDFDRSVITGLGHLGRLHRARPARFRSILPHVNEHAGTLEGLSDEELAWQVTDIRTLIREKGFTPRVVGRTFAIIRELATRKLGQRHFDVQLVGGWVLLSGMVAEMGTGEGKTLTATLAASTAALAGVPVHVVTINDYLAQRDAEWMAPVYSALGLRVGIVRHGQSFEERREAYRCDITYCTNKEVVFDYLRDRLELGRKPGQIRVRLERLYKPEARLDRLRLRGLCFAIVDEADSVLIDEARTPLIISGPGDGTYEAELYKQALAFSEELEVEEHYKIDFPKRQVVLTDEGKLRLEELSRPLGGFWNARLHREDLARKALTARHLFHRDKHYVVKRGEVQIVDEYTGRVMPGRSWEGGLHQLIEAKECCELSTRTEVLARISYQRYFRRYLCLAGMTGTARESAHELWAVYRLEVVSIPSNRPTIRRELPAQMFRTREEKWAAIADKIAKLHEIGRPVLVGTRTVAESEQVGRLLTRRGLQARILNAIQDEKEAEIVGRAGQYGAITVATNMAGRGTDIKLGDGVEELGGLHVMATERHDARRIDRQLFGRCGRQGDPGSHETFVSLEDELLTMFESPALDFLGLRTVDPKSRIGRWIARFLFHRTQRTIERRYRIARSDLLQLDEKVEGAIAYSGRGE